MEKQTVPVDIRISIPWILWSIWKNRNAILYAGTQEVPESIVAKAKEEAMLWHELQSITQQQQEPRHIERMRWQWPIQGVIKCNIHVHWRTSMLHCGVAWIAWNHEGSVFFHARDAMTGSSNHITAELRCVVWALQSLQDLHITDVLLALDTHSAFEAVTKPSQWPRYRSILHHIELLSHGFTSCTFELEDHGANTVAREIASSVTRDSRFQSYLAVGGPSWLQDCIARESGF